LPFAGEFSLLQLALQKKGEKERERQTDRQRGGGEEVKNRITLEPFFSHKLFEVKGEEGKRERKNPATFSR